MNFAEILKDLLNEKEKTIKDLSTEAHIPYTTICGWLKAGRLPDYNALKKLSQYFNVTADYLLGNENEFGIKENATPIQQYNSEDELQLIQAYRKMSQGKKQALFSMLDIEQTEIKTKRNN